MQDDPIKKAYENAKNRWPKLSVDYDKMFERVRNAGKDPKKMALEDLFLALSIEDKSTLALDIFYRKYVESVFQKCVFLTSSRTEQNF